MNRTLAVAALLATVTLSACGKKPQPVGPTPGPDTSAQAESERARAEREAAERARRDEEERARREAERRAAALASRIFFDFDSFDLRPDARSVLDAKVPLLMADGSLRVTVEGHADDQGSNEYNMVLGMRRAVAAREYLAAYGVDASRVSTISYGEERPLVQGTSESARGQNRRAEFVPAAGR